MKIKYINRKEEKIKALEAEISRLKSDVEELKVLNEIAVSSGEATDIDQLLNFIVQKSIIAVNAEQGSIHLATANLKKPFQTIIRQDDRSTLKHNYHIGANITGWVLLNKKPLIIENLSDDERFTPSEDEKKDIRSVLCVPIWFEGGITGLMMLINKKNQKQFSQNDLTLFSIISVQAGQLIKNLELQKETFQKKKETEKLQELDEIKSHFFTNISHEFRTPLTLILGPAKQILEQATNEKIKEHADIIHRSAKKLNRLANQLLDISRIESGKMKLITSKQNIVPIVKEIVSSFQSFTEKKNIKLKFNSEKEKIFLYLDKDKFDKILSNILSNAIKFTPTGGFINVVLSQPITKSPPEEGQDKITNGRFIEITVSDTGIGIPDEQLNKIFDRFYQVDNRLSKEYEGTGVGLSLTKELIELHKGKIFVESEEGKGSIFKILLPLGKEHLFPEEICEEEFISENQNEIENEYNHRNKADSILELKKSKDIFNLDFMNRVDRPSLLIVDDNSDVRKYINDILNNHYNISEAADGEEGFVKSLEQIPDLIISDIMMPKIDGIHLCQSLKSDLRTSHIPIILLTAKTTLQDKIEGLETGADAYIMKPFEASELKVRIKNLLEQRERLHKYFQEHGIFDLVEMRVMPNDKKFIQNALIIINEQISNSSFSVEEFAEGMNISRSLLHKKLSSLIGESPGELIKRIRLKKAAKLIEQNSSNITEVAFEVGFNNSSYFTECFKKQYGVSPSQFKHHN